MTLLAHFSDLHLTPPGTLCMGEVDTAACLSHAIDALLRLPQRPDAVIITGDIADAGHPDAYVQAARLLGRLPMPWHVIPGNHDDRSALRSILGAHLAGDDVHVQYALSIGELTVLALDTLVPGAAHGALCERRLAWLQAALAATGDAPVLIAMHHPPATTGLVSIDQWGLRDGAAAFAALVSAHPNVQAVLCGHQHRAITLRHAGTLVCVAPATAHQVALDFAQPEPRWTREPPGFLLHRWTPPAGLATHVVASGSHPAQRFR